MLLCNPTVISKNKSVDTLLYGACRQTFAESYSEDLNTQLDTRIVVIIAFNWNLNACSDNVRYGELNYFKFDCFHLCGMFIYFTIINLPPAT